MRFEVNQKTLDSLYTGLEAILHFVVVEKVASSKKSWGRDYINLAELLLKYDITIDSNDKNIIEETISAIQRNDWEGIP